MKLLKKIFALLITMAMIANCFTAFPVKAEAAASGSCGDNIYWELYESGELNI